MTVAQLITWLIVGGLAGSLVGAILQRDKAGFGYWKNMAIGLVGALIGGLIFWLFHIDLGLAAVSISAEDLVAAIGGSFLFTLILWIVRKVKAKKAA